MSHGVASFLSYGISQFLLCPLTAGQAKGTAVLRLFPVLQAPSGEAAEPTEQRANELTLHLCFRGGINNGICFILRLSLVGSD